MCLMGRVEERGLSLHRQGKVPGSFYDGHGQEAFSVGATSALGPRTRSLVDHRQIERTDAVGGVERYRGTDATEVRPVFAGDD